LPADEAWSAFWNERARRPTVAQLCEALDSPLRWALHANLLSPATQKLLELADKLAARKKRQKFTSGKRRQELRTALSKWLSEASGSSAGVNLGVGSLAAAHIVGDAGAAIDAGLSWKILDFLTDVARHAQDWRPDGDRDGQAVLSQQLLSGELPLTLAYLFAEMAPLATLRRAATDRLSEGLVDLLNGEGLPHASNLQLLRPLLGCWTRCRALGRRDKKLRWPKKAQRQYEWLVRQALRWTAPDGTPLMAAEAEAELPVSLMRAALRFGGNRQDAAAAHMLLGKKAVPNNEFESGRKTPRGADNCEWSCLAVMRNRWSPADAAVAVDFSSIPMKLDVWADRRRLYAGAWEFDAQIDGKRVSPIGTWQETCWFKDKDVDYLEFTLPLEEGARLERQILLAHRDQFLLLVDHLQHSQAALLEHSWQLPLGPGLLFCGEGETRDALLVDGRPHARAVPLALPEWRVDPRVGELSFSGGAMRLAQRMQTRCMACPVFVDLRPKRSALPSTWRQLTVAESLENKPADVAVSYRIQAGDDQWVYYRSQAARGNRTFLGQNCSNECLVARFKAPEGEIEQLLEVEG
jgi:hypothetical protein